MQPRVTVARRCGLCQFDAAENEWEATAASAHAPPPPKHASLPPDAAHMLFGRVIEPESGKAVLDTRGGDGAGPALEFQTGAQATEPTRALCTATTARRETTPLPPVAYVASHLVSS